MFFLTLLATLIGCGEPPEIREIYVELSVETLRAYPVCTDSNLEVPMFRIRHDGSCTETETFGFVYDCRHVGCVDYRDDTHQPDFPWCPPAENEGKGYSVYEACFQ